MANEFMTIEELRNLAEENDIYIPSRYRKDDIIEVINEFFKKRKSRKSGKQVLKYAPVYAPTYQNIVNKFILGDRLKINVN